MSGNEHQNPPGEEPPRQPSLPSPRPRQDEPQARGPARRVPTGWKVAGWVSAAVALLVVAASLTAYFRYRSVWSSIQRVEIVGLGTRPPQYTSSLNVLLIGSDSRAGAEPEVRRDRHGASGQTRS